MKRRIGLAASLLLSGLTSPAVAQFGIDEARGGILAQDCCGGGSNKEKGVSINLEALFHSPRFLSVLGAPRPLIGASVATGAGATSQIYGGLEWRLRLPDRFFVAGAIGAAVHDGETDRFDPVADAGRASRTVFYGCRILFRAGLDGGYEITERVSASIHWQHISNADLCGDNEGLDHFGLRLGYKF